MNGIVDGHAQRLSAGCTVDGNPGPIVQAGKLSRLPSSADHRPVHSVSQVLRWQKLP